MPNPEFMKELRRVREAYGLTQTDFWGQIGVSQSLGSRLENNPDKNTPAHLLEIIRLRFILGIDTSTITAHNISHVKLSIESAGPEATPCPSH